MIDEWVLSSQLPAIKILTTYIPMTFKNTTPTHKDQNLLIKAVVGGSAADIIKAMQQEKQRSQSGRPSLLIQRPT